MSNLHKYGKTKQLRGMLITMNKLNMGCIEFEGTVKVHGTNAGIHIKPNGEVLVQSRNNYVTGGHYGFYDWAMENKQTFLDYYKCLWLDLQDELIIYGEWAGKGIQSGVGVSDVPKFFYIFSHTIIDGNGDSRHFKTGNSIDHPDIIKAISVGTIGINVNNPVRLNSLTEAIGKLVTDIENDCPVAKARGGSGIGEGIVYRATNYPELVFKVKGQKHSVSKVRTNKPALSAEKLASITEFVEYAVTDNRFNQALEETGSVDKPMSNLGKVLGWMSKDVYTEELDVIEASSLDWKELQRYVTQEVKRRYLA